ncbi:hypothetical protein D2E26_0272 [Bifidobacterium dolichotidis]|uniref:Lipoprotein n=1 Tax=Bifidobacterium dolichotidis TaxID=2306976 RepID=A0A430FS78_9BIFI|nr:hypothetical protein [Bifidobacterium dolichotidis]RSX55709.1 hypothetical protein D2E26_0272 [Bifidobacterium dolichotidis]
MAASAIMVSLSCAMPAQAITKPVDNPCEEDRHGTQLIMHPARMISTSVGPVICDEDSRACSVSLETDYGSTINFDYTYDLNPNNKYCNVQLSETTSIDGEGEHISAAGTNADFAFTWINAYAMSRTPDGKLHMYDWVIDHDLGYARVTRYQ